MESLGRFAVPRGAGFRVFLGRAGGFGSQIHSQPRQRQCRWNRSGCIYEGSYEADERDYAEAEARRPEPGRNGAAAAQRRQLNRRERTGVRAGARAGLNRTWAARAPSRR